MKKLNPIVQKKKYRQPKVEVVRLDTEIALVMMSSQEPPIDPSSIPGLTEYVQKIFKIGW